MEVARARRLLRATVPAVRGVEGETAAADGRGRERVACAEAAEAATTAHGSTPQAQEAAAQGRPECPQEEQLMKQAKTKTSSNQKRRGRMGTEAQAQRHPPEPRPVLRTGGYKHSKGRKHKLQT